MALLGEKGVREKETEHHLERVSAILCVSARWEAERDGPRVSGPASGGATVEGKGCGRGWQPLAIGRPRWMRAEWGRGRGRRTPATGRPP
jgi:hypothetical protein